MTLRQEIYAIAGVAFIVLSILSAISLWSGHKISVAEKNVDEARRVSDEAKKRAATLETAAAEYDAKIRYLEQQLSAMAPIARKQDEELQKLNVDINSRRADVERARSIRSIAANAEELCRRLAELGHGCE